MTYYETLEEIERLTRCGIKHITVKDISSNLNQSERATCRTLKKLREDGKIELILIRNEKGTSAIYKLKQKRKLEDSINGYMDAIARLIP